MEAVIHILYSYLLPTIFVLGLLVLVHELGHFSLAKLVGIRVERFSLGFPPRLFGKKIGDTDYCISAVPFGGYVKMSGMIDESMDTGNIKGEPYEFMSKPIWARFLVIFAGPAFNVFLAMVIFAGNIYFAGISEPVGPVVGMVFENMPAQQIGLQKGDVIKSINGQSVDSWDAMVTLIHAAKDHPISLEWVRNGKTFSSKVTPKLDIIQNAGMIGIGPETRLRKAGAFEAMGLGISSGWNLTMLVGRSFGLLFTGKVPFKESLAGPVRIAKMAGDSARTGFASLLMFAAFLSLNLGILNLLPIPVLDGGHLVFLAIEGVIRRPVSVKIKIVVQQIGMALLLALMVFVIFNDVTNLLK